MDPFQQTKICELIDAYPLAHLDAGEPRAAVYSKLKGLTIEALFEPRVVKDRSMAACCLSGLWLWHSYLDESHKISQEIETSAGSAWHGIMHRREGDFWNANYWFARVRDESLFPKFVVTKEIMAQSSDRTKWSRRVSQLLKPDWSPTEFTHVVEKVLLDGDPNEIKAAIHIASAEWHVLWSSCWYDAVGISKPWAMPAG